MGSHLKLHGNRDGQAIPLPQNLDALTILTEQGAIYIDLAEQVDNMVLMRASVGDRPGDVTRLTLSPMGSGRIAVGVIRTPS